MCISSNYSMEALSFDHIIVLPNFDFTKNVLLCRMRMFYREVMIFHLNFSILT